MNRLWSDGTEIVGGVPMTVVAPSVPWNLSKEMFQDMKRELIYLKTGWRNLQGCSNNRKYQPGLSKQKNLMHMREMADNSIRQFVRNVIQRLYPRLIYFRLGAMRSRGGRISIQSYGYLASRICSEASEEEMP
jgi:hypothetical protein